MAEVNSPVDQLNELVGGIEFAMLTTVRPDGSLHSCPMATLDVDAERVIWFFSDSNTDKIEAIRSNHRVCLAYADPARQRYVSVTGSAELVRDHVRAAALWKPLYNSWFPQGLDDPNLILIKVHVLDAEYWDGTTGGMRQVPGFAKAAATSEQYRSATRKEIDLPENKTALDR